jgi:hypothetical protein
LQHASETLATYTTCVTPSSTFATSIKKQLQHTFKIAETPETYIYNIEKGGLDFSPLKWEPA